MRRLMRAGRICYEPLLQGLFKGGVVGTASDMSWQSVPGLCCSDDIDGI